MDEYIFTYRTETGNGFISPPEGRSLKDFMKMYSNELGQLDATIDIINSNTSSGNLSLIDSCFDDLKKIGKDCDLSGIGGYIGHVLGKLKKRYGENPRITEMQEKYRDVP